MRKLAQTIINHTIGKIYQYINQREITSEDVVLTVKRSLQPDWWSCAIHATYSVINYYSRIDGVDELEKYISLKGIDTPVIIKMLKEHGLKLEEIWDSELDDIKNAIDNKFPIITTINDTEHWIVIHGYTQDSSGEITHLFIVDSAFKRVKAKWAIEKFENMWKEWDERWLGIIKRKNNKVTGAVKRP